MSWTLGTGGTVVRHVTGRIDLAPLVSVIVALLLVRFVLGVRMTWPVVAFVAGVGTVLGLAIVTWGVMMPSSVAFLGAVVLTGQFRRGHGRPSSA